MTILAYFLNYYKNHSFFQSKIILLGNYKELPCTIAEQLPQGIMPHSLAKEIQKLLDDEI